MIYKSFSDFSMAKVILFLKDSNDLWTDSSNVSKVAPLYLVGVEYLASYFSVGMNQWSKSRS